MILDTLVLTSLVGILVMVMELLNLKKFIIPTVILALSIILFLHIAGIGDNYTFNGMLSPDEPISRIFTSIILFTGIVILAFTYDLNKENKYLSDFISVKVFIIAGGIAMVCFQNVLIFFIGLEILSVGLYILVASNKKYLLSNEAAMKYFIMGSFASALFLLGLTFIYAYTGTFDVSLMYQKLQNIPSDKVMLIEIGVFLVVASLLFKTSSFPFHLWSPEVYQGAPIQTTAILATLSKVAAIGALYKFTYYALYTLFDSYEWLIVIIAILTMLIGSIASIRQKNIKRVLAFSGIANSGFMLIPIINSHAPDALNTLSVYAFAYSLANLVIFSILIHAVQFKDNDGITSINGLAKQHPLSAFSVALALLSMAGIPPLLGFFAKYQTLVLAFDESLFLVLAGIISTLISVYIYLKIIWAMYLESPQKTIFIPKLNIVIAFICAISLLLISIVGGAYI